ncbi:MAG TPA: hypothetical protein VH593_27900 [Ktedonobacteraceae bacterium]|jgi:hypothetical protein
MYKVFGGRQQYLDAPEMEVLEQILVWQADQRATKEQQRRDDIKHKQEIERIKRG